MLEAGLFIGLSVVAIVIAFAIYKFAYTRGEYDKFVRSLSEDDEKELAVFTTTGKWRDYMRIHSQTMVERELERRELLRTVAALRDDLNHAHRKIRDLVKQSEPLDIVRPRFGARGR